MMENLAARKAKNALKKALAAKTKNIAQKNAARKLKKTKRAKLNFSSFHRIKDSLPWGCLLFYG